MAQNNKQYPTFIDFRKATEGVPAFGVVIAHLTRDVELRYTPSGKAVSSTGVAVNLGARHINYVLGTEFKEDEVIFIDVTGWEKTAETMANLNIAKGSQVAFTGQLALEEFNNKPRVRLNVSRFQILKRKGEAVAGGSKTGAGNSTGITDDPFAGGQTIDISDDDLPF